MQAFFKCDIHWPDERWVCFVCLQLDDEEEPFVLEDTCVLNTDNMDAHSCDTSSLASSDSGDPVHLKR